MIWPAEMVTEPFATVGYRQVRLALWAYGPTGQLDLLSWLQHAKVDQKWRMLAASWHTIWWFIGICIHLRYLSDFPWFSTGRFGSAKRIQEVEVKLVRHGWSRQVAEDPATYSGWKWAKAMHIQPPSSIEGNQVRFNGAAPAVPKGQHGVVPGMPRWLAGNANDGTVGKPWLFRDAAAGNLKSSLINCCSHKGASDLILGCVMCAVPQVLTRLCFTYSEYFMTFHD